MTRDPTTEEIAVLREMPVFGGVQDQALARLLRNAQRLAVPAGDWFFREGDEGHCMYVVTAGRVRITRRQGDRDLALGELAAGDCLGEMALIDLYPRSASACAATDSEALGIGNRQLLAFYETDPEAFTLIMMNLAREISRRLRTLEARLLAAPEPDRPGRASETVAPEITTLLPYL